MGEKKKIERMKSGIKRIVVCKQISVQLVVIETEHFKTWAVYGPDHFGQMQYWTMPDEASARSFYKRLIAVIKNESITRDW